MALTRFLHIGDYARFKILIHMRHQNKPETPILVAARVGLTIITTYRAMQILERCGYIEHALPIFHYKNQKWYQITPKGYEIAVPIGLLLELDERQRQRT